MKKLTSLLAMGLFLMSIAACKKATAPEESAFQPAEEQTAPVSEAPATEETTTGEQAASTTPTGEQQPAQQAQ